MSAPAPSPSEAPECRSLELDSVAPAPPKEADILKRERVKHACETNDLNALIALATSENGLLDDDLRRKAWPILLGCQHSPSSGKPEDETRWESLPRHRDEDQVQLDVNRAFVYYPHDQSDSQLTASKASLSTVIVSVLRRHPLLCYFQGYHDIAQVLLLALGPTLTPLALSRISLLRIRDYMLPNLTPALTHLHLLPSILTATDPALAVRLSHINPHFALAATLTLYAHDIESYATIARLFDFLLAHEPVVAIYLFAAIILRRREELLAIPPDEPEMLHFTLSKLPKPLQLESLISATMTLFSRLPPDNLPRGAWRRIPATSVLKTSRDLGRGQSLEDGERLFGRQATELARAEVRARAWLLLWKYRRPAASVALAVMVGALSFWVRHRDLDRPIWAAFLIHWRGGK